MGWLVWVTLGTAILFGLSSMLWTGLDAIFLMTFVLALFILVPKLLRIMNNE